jgi:hypothetical protein
LFVAPTQTGCDDGSVPVQGHVFVDGQPVSGGRLSLNPKGKGARAYSLVDEQGAFALRATGGAKGAFPGQYRAFFQQPLDDRTRAQMARELAGQITVSELTLSYRSPKSELIVIPETGADDLVIDIRPDRGWTRNLND